MKKLVILSSILLLLSGLPSLIKTVGNDGTGRCYYTDSNNKTVTKTCTQDEYKKLKGYRWDANYWATN